MGTDDPLKKASGQNFNHAVKKVVDTFLESSHYRRLFRILSDQWGNCHSLTAAVQLMKAHGVTVSPDEQDKWSGMEEERMIDALVSRMPQQSREQFEHFFLQLSLIASTTTRLRHSIENGNAKECEEVLESAEDVGIIGYILKMAVAQAGQEVKHQESAHDTWVVDAEEKIGPLLTSQANSMSAQKKLSVVRATLCGMKEEASERARSVLTSTIHGQHLALFCLTFGAWREETAKNVLLATEGGKYEEQLGVYNEQLIEHSTRQKACARGIMERDLNEKERGLLVACFTAFVDDFRDNRQNANLAASTKEVQEETKALATEKTARAKKVIETMLVDMEDELLWNTWLGWQQFVVDERRAKEMEATLKQVQDKVAVVIQKQSEGARGVLARMAQTSEAGLLQNMFQTWCEYVVEEKQNAILQAENEKRQAKVNEFKAKAVRNAKKEIRRRTFAENEGVMLVVLHYWKRETRIERMRWYGKYINNKRKEQLMNVKDLFTSFADELEDGLKGGTPRVEPPRGKKSGPRRVEDGGREARDGRDRGDGRDRSSGGRDGRHDRDRERDRDRDRHRDRDHDRPRDRDRDRDRDRRR